MGWYKLIEEFNSWAIFTELLSQNQFNSWIGIKKIYVIINTLLMPSSFYNRNLFSFVFCFWVNTLVKASYNQGYVRFMCHQMYFYSIRCHWSLTSRCTVIQSAECTIFERFCGCYGGSKKRSVIVYSSLGTGLMISWNEEERIEPLREDMLFFDVLTSSTIGILKIRNISLCPLGALIAFMFRERDGTD